MNIVHAASIPDWPDRVAAASGDLSLAAATLATNLASGALGSIPPHDQLLMTRICMTSRWTLDLDIVSFLYHAFNDTSVRPDTIAREIERYFRLCCVSPSEHPNIPAIVRSLPLSAPKKTRLWLFDQHVLPFFRLLDSKWGRSSIFYSTGYTIVY
jgi:hypothetical protein